MAVLAPNSYTIQKYSYIIHAFNDLRKTGFQSSFLLNPGYDK